MIRRPEWTKEEVDRASFYRATDDCVFPFICDCQDCVGSPYAWSAKHISFDIDGKILEAIARM